MKVKLTKQYCSPRGTFPPGHEIDVPDAEAQQLIAGSYAVPAAGSAARTIVQPPVETAASTVPVETASPRNARRSGSTKPSRNGQSPSE